MPDIIIRDKDDEHKLRLVIELKADKRATSAYPGRVAESKINDDLKKLNKFTKNSFLKKQIKLHLAKNIAPLRKVSGNHAVLMH